MPHAIQIRQTVDAGEPLSGQVRLRQAAAGLNYIDVYRRTGYHPQPLPLIPGFVGAGTVEAAAQDMRGLKAGKDTFRRSLDCMKPRGLMVTFGQASGHGSHCACSAVAEGFAVSGSLIPLPQHERRDAFTHAADARPTSGSTIPPSIDRSLP
jgi:NADPH:quinone reductase-like Zn-dependent oxidoreductase